MTTSSPNQPSLWQRSTTRRFLKWLFSWRTARGALISVACVVTLWALFCAEESVRGKHAWNRYRQQLEAQGEQLDLQAFIPKPVPDDQNFAATPVVQSWFVRSNSTFANLWQRDTYALAQNHIDGPQADRNRSTRQFFDLVAWNEAVDVVRAGKMTGWQRFSSGKLDPTSRAGAVPSVLEGLKTNEAVFAELRAASQRPYSRYPLVYDLENPWAILLPHLNNVRSVVRRLQLKACAELAAGQSQNALEDVKLMLYLADSVKDEPFLISYLVRIACMQNAIQPVWEGLAERRWSEAQLHELQTRFQQYNFVADLKHPLDTERAAAILTGELIRKKGLGYLSDLQESGSPSSNDRNRTIAKLLGLLVPYGWCYQEELNYCRLFELGFGGTIDGARRQVSPSRVKSNQEALNANFRASAGGTGIRKLLRHQVLAGMLLPALGRVTLRAATAQVSADQAAIACALERYRLTNGQYPETLDAFVPEFISPLPHDVIGGAPYMYRRTDNGSFLLWSVGWNEKDDGGVPGKTLFDEKEGDWVWTNPEK